MGWSERKASDGDGRAASRGERSPGTAAPGGGTQRAQSYLRPYCFVFRQFKTIIIV